MVLHRRLGRPSSIHGVGYWQDTDPTLDGPVAEGTYWHDTSLLLSEGEVAVRMWEGDEWVVAPGGGTVKAITIPIGNGASAVGTGVKTFFRLPNNGRFVGWHLIDGFETPTTLTCDVWVAATGIPDSGDSIVGTTPPTIAAVQEDEAVVDPDDWTAEWTGKPNCAVAVDASSGCTGATLTLLYVRM